MKEIDKILIKQWNQDNPYIQMKNLENVQPGYRVHTVNDDHHLYELPLETQNIILDWVFWNFYPAQKIYPQHMCKVISITNQKGGVNVPRFICTITSSRKPC